MSAAPVEHIVEAALLIAGKPLNINALQRLFSEDDAPSIEALAEALDAIAKRYDERGIELIKVASGYRLQAKPSLSPWLARLFEERPPRYSRSLLETLAIIAYQQPITRAEIEDIRGVAVSTHTMKTLLDREWVHIVGHRETPGRPALLGTTKAFLDHFNLSSLKELPSLAAFQAITDDETIENELLQVQLEFTPSETDTESNTDTNNELDQMSNEDSEDNAETEAVLVE